MNRYALASLLPPSGTDCSTRSLAYSWRVIVTNRRDSSIRNAEESDTRSTEFLSFPRHSIKSSRYEKKGLFKVRASASRLPRFLRHETRGAFPKSVSIDRYRAAQTHCECRRARTNTPTRAHTYARARARARIRAQGGTDIADRMEPPTHHHLYRLHAR